MNLNDSPLFGLVHATRRRRRSVQVLRGLAIIAAASATLILVTGLAAHHYRYSAAVIITLRSVAVLGFAITIYLSLIRPLSVRLPDIQLARLIEERCSNLDERLVTAVEFASEDQRRRPSAGVVGRLIDDADRRAAVISLDGVIHRRELWGYGGAAIGCLLLFIAVLVWGPRQLSSGVAQLVTPVSPGASTNNLRITVRPGSARVPRGSDQQIIATLVNFEAEEVSLFARRDGSEPNKDAQWGGRPMEPAKNRGDFQFFIFDIQDSTEYFVESGGVRSETFRLDVADVPYVKRLDLLINFPAYTRLAAQTMDDAAGAIAALKGSVVQVTARLTGDAKAARIVLRDGGRIEMRRQGESVFVGQLTVRAESSYHIELVSLDGETYNGSNEFDITLLEDRPPVVSFERPGRDTRATSVEEVFTEAKAEDDYGVTSLEMYYSVNGGAEKRVDLQQLKGETARALSGSYTFFLEELSVKPGDFISYYAKARDAQHEATSDIYFIEVKPFELQFRQAQQQGGAGGDGQNEQQNTLGRRQKEIIAATFRIGREQAVYSAKEKAENYGAVALGQERLENDTSALIDRIKRRFEGQLDDKSMYAKLIEHLARAADEMGGALSALKAQSSKDSLPAEQRALQQLLQADAVFREIQVTFGNQEGQGGGSTPQASELADLFELELDKMKNQYETLQREQQQQGGRQEDEAQRKLEELARRQQQAVEQQQRRAAAPATRGGSGGGERQQQQLIDETRRAARELERLSRQRRDQRMQELSQQLNQAADDMQRAQAAAGGKDQSESIAQGLRALQRLEEAGQRLKQARQAGHGRSLEDLRLRAAEAAARQREIAKAVESLGRNNRQSEAAAGEARQRVNERKDALAEAVSNLEKDLDQAARSAGPDGRKVGDQLREAAAALRRNRVSDRIRWNKQKIENDQLEAARAGERVIQENLEELAERIRAAGQAAKGRAGDETNEALEKTRRLADNLESLRRRLNNGPQQPGGRTPSASVASGQQPPGQSRQGPRYELDPAGLEGADVSQGGAPNESSSSDFAGGGPPAGRNRQTSAELSERLREAEDVRQQLGRAGDLSRALEKVIQQLRRLRENFVRDDTQTSALLKSEVIDPLRQIEMGLSLRLHEKLGRGNLRLTDEGSSPEGYRKLVEEYYKRLSNRSLVH